MATETATQTAVQPWWMPPAGVSFCDGPEWEYAAKTGLVPDLAALVRQRGRCVEDQIARTPSSFLALPLEIRLHIYSLLHAMGSLRRAPLAPGYPVVQRHPRRVLRRCSSDGDAEDNKGKMLNPDRPMAGLPTALLRSCSQVYLESRGIPFANNEFVFTDFFSPGLSAAHATLSKKLLPWQRCGIRYVRIDLRTRDLSTPPGMRAWWGVCDALAGSLRGLRVALAGGGPDEWVVGVLAAGFARIRALRRAEVEMEMVGWGEAESRAWCGRVQRGLEAEGRSVEVVLTERVRNGGGGGDGGGDGGDDENREMLKVR
ncbi:hypothetical protein S7711_11176 [Stachybotrys chartarum IBT 7711]|uniref:Uncharacterized protein n=1 Tax=Stachybotrys chartarum (strain CBS 109288 / IBT 7711) TaxID=1280523 RepID=A0A084BCI7_STACB|nr:hypothetical protein S7711_11176 [Stachybotrys chartarum IBT 7711]